MIDANTLRPGGRRYSVPDFANGRPFRCSIQVGLDRHEQRDIDANHIWDAWNDALELLREHGLDHKLPRRTCERMGYTPARTS